MLTTFTNTTSLCKISKSSVIYKFYDASNNELELFAGTTNYTSDATLAGGGTGINADGSKMFIGRVGSSARTDLINYSYDGGVTWNTATHPSFVAIGTLYFRDSAICIASNSPTAGSIPIMVDTTSGFTNNLSFSTIANTLSAGCRALAVSNNCTSTTGYSYMCYQSFFRCTLGTGLNPSSTVTTLANVGSGVDMDIDPDDARYFLLSGTSAGVLSVNSPVSGGRVNITTGLTSLILSVATSSQIGNSIIQTATGTYRITNLSLTAGTMTLTTLSNGTILPANCGAGNVAYQSCKASMSLNGNVVCLIDMNNTPVGQAYLSVDGGSTFTNINTTFGLSNKTFVSCSVSRGGVGNTNYILLLSTAGVYRLTLSSQY